VYRRVCERFVLNVLWETKLGQFKVIWGKVLLVTRLRIEYIYTVRVCKVGCVCVSLSLSRYLLFRSLPPPSWHCVNNFLTIVKSVWGMDVRSGFSKVVAVYVLMQEEDLLAG
jgi:hypothetical protein